jgi:hypothetical protein
MFVVITNRVEHAVYGLFTSLIEANAWAHKHLVGCSWKVQEVSRA